MNNTGHVAFARKRSLLRRGAAVALAGLCLTAALLLYLGHRLILPAPATLGPAPSELHAETIHLPSDSGAILSGWLSTRPDAHGVVLLLHGIRSNKRSMVERALFLHRLGYGTLCLDLQAHGESSGDRITMGHLEGKDVAAAVAYIRARFPALPVAVLGNSLGGASAILANYEIPPDAFILEAVFSDIETAIRNRLEMRLGAIGASATPLLEMQIKPRLGVSPEELSPLRAVSRITAPILFIYGTADLHAKPQEADQLFEAARGPKEIWKIEGAAHEDFYKLVPSDYERRVGEFLSRRLPLRRFPSDLLGSDAKRPSPAP